MLYSFFVGRPESSALGPYSSVLLSSTDAISRDEELKPIAKTLSV